MELQQQIALIKQVRTILKDFNAYFSYLHGKNEAVDLEMPDAAIDVWVRTYEGLTPDEREQATALVYQKCSFHPTPDQFKQMVRSSEDAQALVEWIKVLDILRVGREDALAKIASLSSSARKAMQTVGGYTGLGTCPEAALHSSVKRDFCAAWKLFKEADAEIAQIEAIAAAKSAIDFTDEDQANKLLVAQNATN